MGRPPSIKHPLRAGIRIPDEPDASVAASTLERLRVETRSLISECKASVAAFRAAQERTHATVIHLRAELEAAAAPVARATAARTVPDGDS